MQTILSIAPEEKIHLSQFDVSAAFLYGKLEETIYIQQPEGYESSKIEYASEICMAFIA